MHSVINNIKDYFSLQEFFKTAAFVPAHPVVCVRVFQKLKTNLEPVLKLCLNWCLPQSDFFQIVFIFHD